MEEYYQDYLEFFSNRITKLRMAKGVSAHEMSLAIGQSPGYIGKLERRHCLPKMAVFLSICDYLNIPPKDFFDDEIECPEILNCLLINLKKLNEKQLVNVNNLVIGFIEPE